MGHEIQDSIRVRARELLSLGEVSCVVGHEQSAKGRVRPTFVYDEADADRMVWNGSCHHNLVVYLGDLAKPSRRQGASARVAVVARPCDVRALNVLIHEGQLTYEDEGLELVVDLGVWWKEQTGLPLPLGGNAIRKDLGRERMSELNVILKRSIELGLENREDALAHAMQYARNMTTPLADRFVGMYVNDFTLDYGDQGRRAVELLLQRGAEAGYVPAVDELEFVS